MKNIVPFMFWFIPNSWFHLLILVFGFIYMFTWEPGLDKNVGLSFWTIILLVLIIGKYRYYKKHLIRES